MKYLFYLVVALFGSSLVYLLDSQPENAIQGIKEVGSGPNLEITFLDIGQGDATYIDFGNGEDMLIDCAIDGRILEALGRVMDWKDTVIDYLVVTHPDLDHYGGCEEVLQKFEVKHVLYNGLPKEDSKLWQSFSKVVRSPEIKYREITERSEIAIASTTIEFLYPDHEIARDSRIPGLVKDSGSNDTSIIIQVFHGDTSVLLTGDAEEPLEKYLSETYGEELDVDILKLGHHGSDSSSGEDFLELTSPNDSIVSAGKDNKYGHPSLRVLKRVERVSSTVWRTDEQGDITLTISNLNYAITATK